MRSLSTTFWLFALLVLVLNLLQATHTELLQDEAYYWYYAKRLAWGYFDHPPFVALLASTSAFLTGEIGVRIGSVLLQTAAYFLVYLSLNPQTQTRHSLNFWLIGLSLPLIHLYGFLTLPDSGTLFFTALFIFAYKHFLIQPKRYTPWLALAMAGLMYSKYTGILIILATLLSNLSLIRNKNAWTAVGLSLLLFSPHLWWLYQNEFITLRFHFSERPNHAYSLLPFTGLYFVNALALFGLFAFDIYRMLFRLKYTDLFWRGLQFMTLGVLLFFFFSSFEKKSQLQWLLPAAFPALVLFLEHLNSGSMTRFRFMAISSLFLLGVFRVMLVASEWSPVVLETHQVKTWTKTVEQQAFSDILIFKDSYQKAALYEFYTGNTSLSFNSLGYRPNAYDYDKRWLHLDASPITLVSAASDSVTAQGQILVGKGAVTLKEYAQFKWYPVRYFNNFSELLKLNIEPESQWYAALLDDKKNATELVLLKIGSNQKVLPLEDQDPLIRQASAIRIGVKHQDQPIQLISMRSFKP